MNEQIIRGPILSPRPNGTVDFWQDGALRSGPDGRIVYAGTWVKLEAQGGTKACPVVQSEGLILPPFLDCHTHVPQHPIRGRFAEGVPDDCPEGRLLASLARNVFPQEAKMARTRFAAQAAAGFAQDTLSQGVVGGASYMTVHARAAHLALAELGAWWSVGLVLMNQNCPSFLRTQEEALARDVEVLASEYRRRLIVTDRFAVSTDTSLRRRGVRLARRHGLRMQTHLNEQRAEKAFVEQTLYPGYADYTDVYARDGLLDCEAILAHCLHMRPDEWDRVAGAGASIAHCPTSNTLLGSGTMALESVRERNIPYALCTDVGASPTTSMLAEMAQFLRVHAGRALGATPQEALFRATLAPAQILGLERELGSFGIGMPLSFVEARCDLSALPGKTADAVIAECLLEMPAARDPVLDDAYALLAAEGLPHGEDLRAVTQSAEETAVRLEAKVQRVVLRGETVWERGAASGGAG